MNAKKRILFLHGLGQGPDSWRAVAERLTGVDAVIPDLGAMLAGRADYLALRGALFAVCDAEKAPLHLCGLSLGGVLALAYAAHRPERVASLVLIGTPYTMPKRLLKLQDLLFAITPRTAFESLGLTKRQMRGLSLSMATLEIPALLPRVRCRTLVLCGEKDRANRKAARQLQEGLSNAAMQTIDGAGHEANREAPEALSAALAAFYGAE
ncbi:MAG: alpha/beta fold hydrolase [Clostridiales bacterium]|nr:alpha/beta fold hydrolase [Clostridiales bacterium]